VTLSKTDFTLINPPLEEEISIPLIPYKLVLGQKGLFSLWICLGSALLFISALTGFSIHSSGSQISTLILFLSCFASLRLGLNAVFIGTSCTLCSFLYYAIFKTCSLWGATFCLSAITSQFLIYYCLDEAKGLLNEIVALSEKSRENLSLSSDQLRQVEEDRVKAH
jgi:hypothetical protein